MRKAILFLALGCCLSLMARDLIVLPRLSAPPVSLTAINPAEWEQWSQLTQGPNAQPAPFEYQAFGAYDSQMLYIALDVPLGRRPKAGNGEAIPWFSEGAEFRFALPNEEKLLQLFTDASGATILQRKWRVCPRGDILLRAQATEKGYSLFAAFPWHTLGLEGEPSGKSIHFNLIPQWMLKPLKFNRHNLGLTLKMGDQMVEAKPLPDPATPLELNSGNHVRNFGKPGYNCVELLALLNAVLDDQPQTAIIMVGTNDITWPAKHVTAENYETTMDAIFNTLKKANVPAILVTIPPCIPEYVAKREKLTPDQEKELNDKIIDFNARAKRTAEKYSAIVADYHALFTGNLENSTSLLRNQANSRSADGVHPTAEGYQRLAAMLAEVIRTHNLPTGRIACCGDSITYGAHMEGQGTSLGETYPAALQKILFPATRK